MTQRYYAVENAVWFKSASPRGPWVVAASVPAVLYTIPSSSPLHYVTDLKIYDVEGDTVYVGRGGRTNAAGVRQVRAAFEPLGARVVAVPVTKVPHLKSAVTALPGGTVIGHVPNMDAPALFPRFLPVPEPSGAHVVLLGGDRLLMAASAPKTAEPDKVVGSR